MTSFIQRLAVEILITGFVIEESDFFRPWEGEYNNLERWRVLSLYPYFVHSLDAGNCISAISFPFVMNAGL